MDYTEVIDLAQVLIKMVESKTELSMEERAELQYTFESALNDIVENRE